MANLNATVSIEALPAADMRRYHDVARLARKVLESLYEFEDVKYSSEWVEALEAELQKLENSRSFAHYSDPDAGAKSIDPERLREQMRCDLAHSEVGRELCGALSRLTAFEALAVDLEYQEAPTDGLTEPSLDLTYVTAIYRKDDRAILALERSDDLAKALRAVNVPFGRQE